MLTFTIGNVKQLSFQSTLESAEKLSRVPTHPEKSWNLRKQFSRPGKSWKMTVVMDVICKSHGIPPVGHGMFNRRIMS